MGAGPAGLSVGKVLTDKDVDCVVYEKDDGVGGISRTENHNGFRFDLGGHRFFTKKNHLNEFLSNLMGDELINVSRSSKIFLKGKYFDYPPTPINAFFGFGPFTAIQIACSYAYQKVKGRGKKIVTMEDWIISEYGKRMFEIFFRPYNEKIWGVPTNRVDASWVAQRIKGMSLINSIKNALFKDASSRPVSLISNFMYPKLGIGRISDRLAEHISAKNKVHLSSRITGVIHEGWKITGVKISPSDGSAGYVEEGTDFLSSIPITELIHIMEPAAPPEVIEAADKLLFRDLIVVAIMFDMEPITQDTWIYLPELEISFGRLHEPTNWSMDMSPKGKTSIAFEFWCSEGDWVWNKSDSDIVDMTIKDFEALNLDPHASGKIIDHKVVRVRKAYPMYVIGYERPLQMVRDYLAKFENLTLIGRYGTFMYNNMDHCIETGIRAAENLCGADHDVTDVLGDGEYLEEIRKS